MLLLYIILMISNGGCQDGPIVETIYGLVQGTKTTNEQGLTYEEYIGIPYAAPPTGEGRFSKPVPPENWDNIRQATEYGAHCIQFPPKPFHVDGLSNETSEDCLFLNVYVPGEQREGNDLAILVWVHGGGFFQGTSALYPSYDLSLYGDIIVVTVNYRLGPLGWLSTEDSAAPGNYGLWDVKLSLEWVRDNIRAFGGDPDRVSIFGLSAGGAIASHVMVSPQTDDLVIRGGALSGSSSGYFGVGLPGNVANTTYTLARTMGCRNYNTSEELIDCLREKDPEDLNYWGFITAVTFRRQMPNFIPVIDGDFIPIHPAELWRQGAAANKDFLTGASVHDSARFVMPNIYGMSNDSYNLAATNESLELAMKYVTNHFPGDFDQMEEAIFQQYPDIEDNNVTIRTQSVVNATTDGMFDTWAHYEAAHHTRTSTHRTYLYEYGYSNSFLTKTRNNDHSDWLIALHGDDLYSMFGEPFRQVYRENELDGEFDETDLYVSNYVMAFYCNFINTGNANDGLGIPLQWIVYNNYTQEYMEMTSSPRILSETTQMLDNYNFWVEEFSQIAKPNDNEILLDDVAFEEALAEGVDIVQGWVDEQYQGYPDVLF